MLAIKIVGFICLSSIIGVNAQQVFEERAVPLGSSYLESRNELEDYILDTGDKLNIKFTEIDIDFDKEGYEIAKKLQNQNPRIPTIVFEDGSYLVEPSDVELIDKLNSL